MKLSGKTAIITGAGRGLGRACALAIADEGAHVTILSRTAAELAVTDEMVNDIGGKSLPLEMDISKPEAIKEAVEETVSVFGGVDILVNNAATGGPAAPIADISPKEWAAVMDINLNSAYRFTSEIVPHMSERGGGKIINVTSGMADIVMPLFGAYSISKAALNHLTRILAEELRGHNIQVNGLDPGIMDTAMQDGIRELGPGVLGKPLYEQFVLFKEEGHLKKPEDIAPLAIFLASSESDTISGEIGSAADFAAYGYGLEG